MKNKLFSPFKNNKGDAVHISTLFGILAIIAAFVFVINICGVLHDYFQLNVFAKEIAYTAARGGMCDGDTVDERFSSLKEITGIKPNISFEASYISGSKRVQYGDPIKVKLTYETKLLTFGNAGIPLTLTATAMGESKEYWKNV